MIFEIVIQSLFQDVVIAVVLAFRAEYSLPCLAAFQLPTRNEFRNPIRNGNRVADFHDQRTSLAAGGRSYTCRSFDEMVSTFRTPSRMCTSRCGKAISIPASRSFCSIAKLRSLR